MWHYKFIKQNYFVSFSVKLSPACIVTLQKQGTLGTKQNNSITSTILHSGWQITQQYGAPQLPYVVYFLFVMQKYTT